MRALRVLFACLLVFASDCGGGENTGPDTPVAAPTASVTASLASATLTVGSTTQATATSKDASGNTLTGRVVTWSSSNAAVATVNAATGSVTAVSVGSASITAASEGQSGAATLSVTPVPVASVTVVLAAPSVVVGATTQATATTKDASANVLTGRVVAWSSSNTAVATVNATTGVVTTVSVGTANITATSEGQSGSAALSVTPVPVASVTVSLTASSVVAGATSQATATMKDASANVLTGRVVTWSSSNTAVATVNATTGLVTTVSAGTANITATSEGQSGSAALSVTPVPVASVTVSLAASSVLVGATTQATATTKDAGANVLTGRVVTWSSSNTAVATVNATTGLVTTVSVGAANITATSEGQTGSASLTVIPVPVSSVLVVLAAPSVVVGGTTQATATTKDAGANVLTGRVVAWASSNTAVATVNATTGLVTSVSVGTVSITATSEGKSGSATLTVTAVPVSSVTVALATSSLAVGRTTQATATTKDAGANILTGRVVTWSSSNTGVATVNATTGVVTAISVGSASITATSEGQTGSASITVTAATCSSVPLTISQSTTATILAGGCALANTTFFAGGRNFVGPEGGGTYFYNLYTIDVAANTVATVSVARGTLPFATTLFAFTPTGVFVSSANADAALTINNTSASTVTYQVLISTTSAGATGTYTLTPTVSTGVTCPTAAVLAISQSVPGAIQAGSCALANTTFFTGGRNFTGPESGGTYFYNLYTIDVAANTVATVSVARGTLPFATRLFAFTTTGVFVSSANADAALTINNTSASTVTYQVLISTTSAGAAGTYTLTPTVSTALSCPSATVIAISQSVPGTIQAGSCALANTTFFSGGRSFTGPESGGTYFYNLYTIDVAANTVATVSVARGTLPFATMLFAFTTTGVFVSSANADAALTINNTSASTVTYQVLISTTSAGSTGTYTLSRGPQ